MSKTEIYTEATKAKNIELPNGWDMSLTDVAGIRDTVRERLAIMHSCYKLGFSRGVKYAEKEMSPASAATLTED